MVPRPTTRKQPKREDHKMLEQAPVKRSLMEMELEVEAEGREWMRQRLQKKGSNHNNGRFSMWFFQLTVAI